MHISEGILSPLILFTGALLSGGGVAVGLKKMDFNRIPEVAVISSAFFVASLIHVPIGPVSAHLVLNGLVGILLGWLAFPSILVALSLQAVLFQYGGLTTLGINTFIMATPAVIVYYLFSLIIKRGNQKMTFLAGFLSGALGVALASIFMSLSLLGTGEEFTNVIKIVILANIPVMIVEGLITAFCVAFLKKLKPELVKA